ncbi:erythromycin esterase family protein [Pendulispora albinea]|uniref:Erythromycin esterase family protein n=1 Tax=Pendulispora albinea TaxID=2741071 RepID=A0ABZ2MCL7_9BACT
MSEPELEAIRRLAVPLSGAMEDYNPLLERIGEARFVLLGEASHGTHEFYGERARITTRLIAERGFDAVAVEADWPDAYRVHRYVRGSSSDGDAEEALRGFRRFPTWMWRNADVLDFVGWLREHNEEREARSSLDGRPPPVGFFGLDLYSLYASMAEVLRYLEVADPHGATKARARYACFDHYGGDAQAYAYATGLDLSASCEREVMQQLLDLQARAMELPARVEDGIGEALFDAEQNARLVKNAEQYYRHMLHGRVSTWNLRDRHMMETLRALDRQLAKTLGRKPKIVVWEHNSHVGDARATDMSRRGEWNLGELVRQTYSTEAYNIGFTTYEGTVTAASNWDAPAEHKRVRPGMRGSYEELFHRVRIPRFMLVEEDQSGFAWRGPRLERAIGVVYRPETERLSHYFHARLSEQFDAVIHIDRTRAVEPLERDVPWQSGEAPETYPFAV